MEGRRIWKNRLADVGLVAFLTVFVLSHLIVPGLFEDTMTVGGDIPAHNYMASHLRASLLGHGQVVSWAPGWWCGFPLFQYYFSLPYVLVVLLSLLVPLNVAFKLVVVSCILLLPAACYASARLFRLPRPIPVLFAMASIFMLFTKSHTMWGVNIYSTFSGMIANSLSFPLMLLALGATYDDLSTERFRLRTVFLIASVLASHFFTAIMLAMLMMILPLSGVCAKGRWWRGYWLLFREGGVAVLLMSWWLVPLMAKKSFSVDFGVNWPLSLPATLPYHVYVGLPLVLCPLLCRHPRVMGPYKIFVFMTVVAIGLFEYGTKVSLVFANVRLWPFLFAGILFLIAIGAGLLLRRLPYPYVLVGILGLGVVTCTEMREKGTVNGQGPVRSWAEFNFSSLKSKPCYSVFRDLVMPLRGTPGRLANDLTGENNAMGSCRIFESVPHIIGKPILEGGLVNSAIGSYFSYYIQGETSQGCAGFPNIVKPTTFNLDRATKHLTLFNVKHFIARWSKTREAMRASPDWRLLKESSGWELFELLTHEGKYVFIPENLPIGVMTDHWESDALEWIYRIEAMSQPFVFITPREATRKHPFGVTGTNQFMHYLNSVGDTNHPSQEIDISRQGMLGGIKQCRARDPGTRMIEWETLSEDHISFKTRAIGEPHMIKCSYFPNWHVRGAERVYLVSPDFMLVYPTQELVELYYGSEPSDIVGRGLTCLGWVLVAWVACCSWRTKRRAESP